MTNFTVSIITMDHLNIQRDVELVDALGVDGLHVDVMDGKFVPRFGIYPEIVERINDVSSLPLDIHFMVDDVIFSLNQFSNCRNIDTVTFQLEACAGNELRVIDQIKTIGAKPIIGLNLATCFNQLDRLVSNNEIDGVMLMGIHPGVLKQQARPKNILNDLKQLKEIISGSSAENYIGLDGAVNFDTLEVFLEAGITHFIGGSSSIFKDAGSELASEKRNKKVEENWEKITQKLKL